MKTKIQTLILLLSLTAAPLLAQDIYTPVLRQIEQNSKKLKTLQRQYEAQKISNKTGLTPANPEVEWGYFRGRPAELGVRQEIIVKQTLDFPTVYLYRKNLSDRQNRTAHYQYLTDRMELMFAAKSLCIELVRYNALRALYDRILNNARRIATAYDRMNKAGSVNVLEYNKAILNLTNAENKLKLLNLERDRLLSELAVLNGGEAPEFAIDSYPAPEEMPDFDIWYTDAQANSPLLLTQKEQEHVGEQQLRLTRSETLPKLSVGYLGEFLTGERFQGITVGVSIPLWENKNRIRQAKAELLAARAETEESRTQHQRHYRNLYDRAKVLRQNIDRYNAVLVNNRNDALLFKAYDNGEISLLTYLLEVEYFFEAYEEKLNMERDLALVQAELTAHRL